MNRKEQSKLNQFPNKLDELIIEKFGEETECQSSCDFFGDMKFRTNFKDNGKNKEEIQSFIDGFMAGNLELRERLLTN